MKKKEAGPPKSKEPDMPKTSGINWNRMAYSHLSHKHRPNRSADFCSRWEAERVLRAVCMIFEKLVAREILREDEAMELLKEVGDGDFAGPVSHTALS